MSRARIALGLLHSRRNLIATSLPFIVRKSVMSSEMVRGSTCNALSIGASGACPYPVASMIILEPC